MALPSSDEVISALIRDGFHPRGKSGGSHQVFRKELPKETRTVVVPLGKKEIPRGTLRSGTIPKMVNRAILSPPPAKRSPTNPRPSTPKLVKY